MSNPDICVLMNVGSGKRRGVAQVAELEAEFARYPGRFTLRQVAQGGQIANEARRALKDGFATVVAAGGDGTICGVASVLAGSGRRMGVLPLGTFNYFARSLDLPQTLPEAVAVLAGEATRPIDVGRVNDRVFLNNASLGAYAAILERREDIYRRWGRSRLAAFWSVFVTLIDFRHPLTLRVTVDGKVQRRRTPLAFVAANAYQLEEFELEGADCVRDGQFALYLAPDATRVELLGFALRLGLRRMEPGRDFELLRGSEILVETLSPERLVARDGEREKMRGPFRFTRQPGALEMLVPAKAGE